MKNMLLTLRSALLLFLLLGTVPIALGQRVYRPSYFYYGGIRYHVIDDGTASVMGGYEEDGFGGIVIPSTVTVTVSNYGEDYNFSFVVIGVDADAFKNNSSLTGITLPSSVKWIGNNAFYGCSNLTNVNLSAGLESIGGAAFAGCTSLQSIAIPNSVTSLMWNAFYGCTGLTNVTLSNNLHELSSAFSGCTSLESITIPASVISLDGTFKNCTSLRTVTLPNSLSTIGAEAFSGCSGLQSVYIPNSVTQIGDRAFGNTGLTAIVIPNSVTTIGANAFEGCNQLAAVTSRPVGPPVMSNQNSFAAWVYQNAVLTVPLIAENTYRQRSWWNLFQEITGSEALNTTYDFEVGGLYYNKVGDNKVEVTYKDNNYNSYTGTVTIPSSVSYGGRTYSVTGIGNFAFYNCSSLTAVTLPTTITVIGSNSFALSGLTAISLPNSVTTIAAKAFYGTKLSSLTVPQNVTTIGKEAFASCGWLTQLTWNAKRCWSNGDLSTDNLNRVTIGNAVEALPVGFVAQSRITTINIPASVTGIGSNAFNGCSSLTDLTIPKSVNTIGRNAFAGCTGLTSLIWKAINCATNGNMYTNNLNQVSIGNDVVILPAGLAKNSQITTVSIPGSVTDIEGQAFYGCSHLTSLVLPETTRTIGEFAFYGCSALTSLTIPRTVVAIGYSAFEECDGLTSLTWNAVNCTTNGDMSTWNLTQVNIGSEVEKLPISFAYDANITAVSIPNSVDSICSAAFAYCSGLEEIVIPDHVTYIGAHSFVGCTGLTKVVIPDEVTEIGTAFEGCTNLTSVTIGASVNYIGTYAFRNCTSLEKLICLPLTPPTLYGMFNDVPNSLIVYVLPDALEAYQSDYYWSRYTILPTNLNRASLTVNLPADIDTAYVDMKLGIVNRDSDIRRHLVVSKNKFSYKFGALEFHTNWDVVLTNHYGDELGKIDNVAIGEEDETVTFASLKRPQTVTLTVRTPDGQDVTAQSRISWLDESGELLVQGKEIGSLPPGRKLVYSVRLPQQLATKYSLPANRTYTVAEGNNNIICQLAELSEVHFSGIVKEAEHNQPLYGSSVSVTQTFAGGNTNTLTAMTDSRGIYSMDAYSVPTTITVTAQGYKSQTLDCTELITGENEVLLPPVTLLPLTGVVVNVNMTYTPVHADGEDVETQNWYSDYQNVDFEVYNVTAGRAVTDLNVAYPRIVIMEDVNDGDVLELKATSRSFAFMPVRTTVTVAEQKATATFNILEYGKLTATYNRNSNPSVAGTLYRSNGNLERVGEYSNGSISFDGLSDGEYTLITMGESGFYNSINDLSQFPAVGLNEGEDYVKNDVLVQNGLISQVTIDEVPFFAPEGFFTDLTSFMVTKPSIVIGNFQTFRAQVDFKEQYANRVQNVKLIVDLPESCSFMDNSVQVGSEIAEYTIQGNRVIVPLDNYKDVVRLCAIPTEAGDITPSAFVQFRITNETITVPIGSAKFSADALSINVPSTVATASIPVSGTAIGQCAIDIYDNDVLIGQTTSIANGDWSTVCELHEPYNLSWHDLHAKVTTGQGLTLLTENALCRCDMDAIKVKKVKMYHHNPSTHQTYEIEYDFQNPTNESQSWSVYYPKKVFTFTIDFTNNSPEVVSNVVLCVHTADGSYLPYYPEYDPEQDLWVVNCDLGSRPDSQIPVNVSLDYYANTSFSSTSVISLFEGCAIPSPISGLECQMVEKQGDDIISNFLFGNSNIVLTSNFRSISQIPTGIEYEQDTLFDQIIYTNCSYQDNTLTVIFPRGLIDMFSSSTNEESKNMYNWADSVCTNNYLQIKVHVEEEFTKNGSLDNQARLDLPDSFFSDVTISRYVSNCNKALYIYNEMTSLISSIPIEGRSNCNPSWADIVKLRKLQEGLQSSFPNRLLGDFYRAAGGRATAIPLMKSESNNIVSSVGGWLNFATDIIYSNNKRGIYNILTRDSSSGSDTSNSNVRNYSFGYYCDGHPNEPGNHRPNRPNDKPIIDPAGFVYEGVPSNRLEGVTATCYYKEMVEDIYGDQHEEIVLWDAEQYGQENPLLTNDYGYYHWDVPVGMWQVKYEKAGYETTYSDWLPVPPPQMQVNIGMVQMRQPEVIKARAYQNAVEFEFDKFMLPEDLTTLNIKVTDEYGYDVYGEIELLNAEVDDPNAITSLLRAPGTGGTYASKVRFNAYDYFYDDEVTLRVSKRVKSYAGLEMDEDYVVTLPVEYEMERIEVDTTVTMLYGDSRQLTVTVEPYYASMGKTLTVRTMSPMILSTDAETYTLDNNGQAVVTVRGDLPGVGSLLFGIEGYDLSAATLVNVMMESQMTVAKPTASVLSGNEVEPGTAVYLYCATEGATIYYTLDGSCPCDNTSARKVYDGNPIIINSTTTIKAMATAPDLYDSDVVTFIYRVAGGKKGDVNGDGEVNVADINACIDVILGGLVSSETRTRADVNGDGEINVADINAIIDIILGAHHSMMHNVNCEDVLHMDNVTMKPGDVRVLNVTVDHANRYSALQCDIVLPAGLTLVGVSTNDGHISKVDALDEVTSRAFGYSMSKRPFVGEGSPVMSFTVRADAALASESEITLTNIVLADGNNKAWYANDCTARVNNTSGINDLTVGADRVWVEGSTLFVDARQKGSARLVTVNGMVIDIPLKAGVNSQQLDCGIYIVVVDGHSHKITIK